jgi:adenylate cyclase
MRAGSPTLRTTRLATERFIQQVTAVPSRVAQLWQRLQPQHFPIAYKLALIITLVITVGMSLLGMVVVDNQTRLLRQQMNQFGHALINQMAETVKEPLLAGDALALRLAADGMTRHGGVLGAVIYSDELEPLVAEGLTPPDAQLRQLQQQLQQPGPTVPVAAVEWDSLPRSDNTIVIAFFAPIVVRELTTGYVLLTFDHSQLSQAQRDTLRAVTAATLLMVLLGAVTAILLGQRLSRPINELMDASLQVSRGNYSFRFAERRNDELGTLMQAFNTMSDGLVRKEQVELAFSRYVSPKVAKEVLSDLDQVQLGGQHTDASVLFADIAGFTALSENLTPQQISTLLNDYFGVIAEAALAYQGHVDKYMGDCAMLVFGVPQPDAQHTLNAVCCAVLIQRLISELNRQREANRQMPVHFHISCNSGMMLAGNMGSHDRMDYTVVGDAVNLASRLSTVAEAEQIIISKVMHDLPILAGHLVSREHDTIRLRGKQQPVATFQVLDLTEPLRSELEQHYHHILRRRRDSGA